MKAASTFLSVLAILGALGAGALWYLVQGQKEQLTQERDGLRMEKASLESRRDELTTQVNDLTGRNTALGNELGEVKTRNTTLEARANQLNRDLAQARANTESALNDARKATEDVASLRQQVISLTAQLEGAAGEAEKRIAAETRIKELEERLNNPLGAIAKGGSGEAVPDITTSVASVGPRSAFVVINAGAGQGLRNAMKVAINRGGEVVAQAVVTELRENLAIAQVIPNTLIKAPKTGDEAYTVR